MIRNFIYGVCICFCLISCNGDTKTHSDETPNTEQNTTPQTTPVQNQTPEAPTEFLTPTDFAILDKIKETATQMDIIFPGQPMSVSQQDKASITQSLAMFSNRPVGLPLACTAMGRMFYVADGEEIAAIDVHFKNGCTFFVFMENEKPIHGGQMAPAGAAFFNQILAQGRNFPKPNQ